MREVRIFVLLDREIHRVAGHLDDLLVDFYEKLRDEVVAPRYTECKFYQLKNPVLVRRGHLDETRQECLKAGNREELTEPITIKVRDLADNFKTDYIYLAIESHDPSTESDVAIQRLRERHGTLFGCLHLVVESLDQWSPDDVTRNMDGGVLTETDDRLPPELKVIRDALETRRLYEAVYEMTQDFSNAQSYDAHFNRVFASCGSSGLPMVTNAREFAAFYNVLRCFHKDAASIHDESSSSLKATTFTAHFIHPPFFSENQSHHYEYHQEESWRFPVFLNTESSPNTWCKLTPKSGNLVASPLFSIPFVFSEMISENEENGPSRILVKAIAVARAGQYLLKSTSKKRFFVVAICLDTSLVASRYIVMQTGMGDNPDGEAFYKDKAVCIHRKDFNLRHDEQSTDFLREMYNLETQINELAGEVDKNKWRSLMNINVAAEKLLSLNTVHHSVKRPDAIRQNASFKGQEGRDEPRNLGVFGTEDIQSILLEMNYKIQSIPWRHSLLARIVSNTGDNHGYLKFVETDSNELKILRFLTNIRSFSNHTISDVQIWPVEGGTLISMPVAGGWLTSLETPNDQMWSVALQLFEAVAFMHEHNVAHMSLSPQHILIPFNGGWASIIDFSSAIQLDEPEAKHVGIIGTKGYIAPEIYIGDYKPMLADLWSCGKTLEALCARTAPCRNADRNKVLEISKKLMDQDPEARPKMTSVLQWMASVRRNQDSDIPSPLVVSTLSPIGPV